MRGVEVDAPGTYVTTEQIEQYAEVPLGGPLATANLDSIRTRVTASLPPLKTVDVSRSWPDKVLIRVTERTPVAVIDIAGQLRALDADGTVFLRLKRAPAGLPQVSSPAGTDAEALSGAAEVAAALPDDLSGRVDHVEVQTADAISLRLRDGRSVEWGSASDSDTKADVLLALLRANPRAPGFDVSVPGQPVVLPG